MNLVEQLVAGALLLLVFVVALGQLDLARHSFKTGEGRAELQIGLRVAIDRLAREIGQAGLNVGARSTVDEAIEFAGPTAIVFRADLDWETADAERPERELAGALGEVATGNDEIVGYFLARPGGGRPGALRFDADVIGVPRDGRVEAIVVDRVDLAQTDPPYTLYRLQLRPDSARALRMPLIDNVRSLRFEYFDHAGKLIAPPGGGPEGRVAREAIRRVRLRIERQSLHADPRWIDPHDSHPTTRHHRKLAIALDLSPRNLRVPYSANRHTPGPGERP